jgi:hypothetical protein
VPENERVPAFEEAHLLGDQLMALTTPVALYGFQLVPDVRVVTSETGWQGWFEDKARPLLDRGRDLWVPET